MPQKGLHHKLKSTHKPCESIHLIPENASLADDADSAREHGHVGKEDIIDSECSSDVQSHEKKTWHFH
jgi:hypothetical protein